MNRSFLLLLLGGTALAAPARAQDAERYLAVHCEPDTAGPEAFDALRQLVFEADARHIRLTVGFSPSWAEMLLAEPPLLDEVRGWQLRGHEIAAHHHDVHAEVWDGYSDLRPGQIDRPEPWRGTMADFRDLLAAVAGPPGLRSASMPSASWEWPYGVPFRYDGAEGVEALPAEFRIENHYGVWTVRNVGLSGPGILLDLEILLREARPPRVLGVATHVRDFQADPGLVLGWMDAVAALDPLGLRNRTVAEILEPMPPALTADPPLLDGAQGGLLRLELRTLPFLAGLEYRFLLSFSGITPGTDWNGVYDEGVHIGLNRDAWTERVLELAGEPGPFQDFRGLTGPDGGAAAFLDLGPLPPSLLGRDAVFAGLVLVPEGIAFSSNPAVVAVR